MKAANARQETRASLLVAALFVLAGVGLLIGLGVWQLKRLTMKNDVVTRIEARIHAAPQPLPPAQDWAGLASGDHEYERFTFSGVFENDREALIYRSTGKVTGALAQPGYWVMTPLRLADGWRVLVNRGFIALDRKAPASRAAGQIAGPVVVTGLLRTPEPRSYFTPPDNPANGEWFTRDPIAIATALKLEQAAPFSIDEDARAAPPGAPAGGATVLDIPNNHLSYALTWFGLAATLIGVFAAFVLRR